MSKKAQAGKTAGLVAKIPEFQDRAVISTTRIATLWSNYGSIERVALRSPGFGSGSPSNLADADRYVIVKTVSPPWTDPNKADEGHLRKLLSYEVERWFYYNLADRLPAQAKVATPYLAPEENGDASIRLLMEDLSVDCPVPARGSLGLDDTKAVLSWLANFHGTFWGVHHEDPVGSGLIPPPLEYHGGSKQGVWQQGTYWYLDTRRTEFSDIDADEKWLLEWAEKVDAKIKDEAKTYGTLLHGDAKGANIFFAPKGQTHKDGPRKCALYDFQYVGVGLVTRDLVYFLGTSVLGNLMRRLEDEKNLLKPYHSELTKVLNSRKETSHEVATYLRDHGEYDFDKFWQHWELALVDWYRFMAGWGFWGNDQWIERRARDITAHWRDQGFAS